MLQKLMFSLSILLIVGCSTPPVSQDSAASSANSPQGMASVETATAVVAPGPNQRAKGVLHFTQTQEGVRVEGQFEGLKPRSRHGIHVHERGDCSDPKFMSAGGHFNPTHSPHGGPDQGPRHLGDFGNLQADPAGRATFDETFPNIRLDDPKLGVLGRAVVVHKQADDLQTQPSGDSGDRIACGVITKSTH